MPRVSNVEIPSQKRGEISLTYIFGIGRSTAKTILSQAKVNPDKKVAEWTEQELSNIRQTISESYTVEGELKRALRNDRDRLNYISCNRGIRLRQGLRVRGQRSNNKKRRQRVN